MKRKGAPQKHTNEEKLTESSPFGRLRDKYFWPSIKYFASEMRELKQATRANNPSPIAAQVEQLSSRIRGLESKIDTYAAQIYRQPDESDFEARRRMFRNLPETTGKSRLLQIANTKLLGKINDFCVETGTKYWMWAGSAVAITGRNASIPWDDDIDICMMREDFEKFRKYVNKETDYYVTKIYDYNVKNIQYRFIYRDVRVCAFIDIVVCDWGMRGNRRQEDKYLQIVDELHARMDTEPDLAYWRDRALLRTPNEPKTQQIGFEEYDVDLEQYRKCNDCLDRLFAMARRQAEKCKILCNKNEADAVVYSVENWFSSRSRPNIWPKEVIFPVQWTPYENIQALSACRDKDFCDMIYPGWPFIPNIVDVRTHQGDDNWTSQTQEALLDFIEE